MVNKEDAAETIRPHAWILAECWTSAQAECDEIKKKSPESWAVMSLRTQASILSDLLTARVERRFIGASGANTVRRHGRTGLVINGTVYLRFKKLGKNLRPTYTRTKAAIKSFEIQGKMEELDVPATNLVNGYVHDAFGNHIRNVITCPFAGGNEWVLELSDITGQGELDFGVASPSPKSPIVRPKTDVVHIPKRLAEGTDGLG